MPPPDPEPESPPGPEPESPLFPPAWFVARYNAANPGRYRTALDPVLMALWHQVSAPPERSQLTIITGI